jgi:hypothetical protein
MSLRLSTITDEYRDIAILAMPLRGQDASATSEDEPPLPDRTGLRIRLFTPISNYIRRRQLSRRHTRGTHARIVDRS